VVFDASFLIPLLDEKAPELVPAARKKVRFLLSTINKANEVIVVPTPALSKLLVKAGEAGPEWIRILSKSARFKIAAFETLAAIEAAQMTAGAIAAGDKKGGVTSGWQKVKFDRQIIAIARVAGVEYVYSHDPDLKMLASGNPEVQSFDDLPLPPAGAQADMEELWKPDRDDDNGEV